MKNKLSIMLILGIFSCLFFISFPVFSVTTDDPGVTISSPEKINSSGLVDLKVTLAASAGNLSSDGNVQVIIPKYLRI